MKSAGPSDAVQIQGFEHVPQAADLFAVVEDERQIKRISGERQRIKREIEQKKQRKLFFCFAGIRTLIVY